MKNTSYEIELLEDPKRSQIKRLGLRNSQIILVDIRKTVVIQTSQGLLKKFSDHMIRLLSVACDCQEFDIKNYTHMR